MTKEKKSKKTRMIELILAASICILLVTEGVLLITQKKESNNEKPILTQEEAKKIDRKNMESAKDTVVEKEGADITIGTKDVAEVQETEQTRDYIIEDSYARALTMEELTLLTAEELQIARNEILARHGRKFEDEKMQMYFESKSWYSGTMEAAEFDAYYDSILSETEKANVQLIQSMETMGETETTETEE